MTQLSVPAIRFTQNDRVFYCTAIPAGELIARSKVDTWSADASSDIAGYQREPSRSRLRGVASYMEKSDAIMPMGGLLNARSSNGAAYGQKLEFSPTGPEFQGVQAGQLTIPEKSVPLFIVDMQHRLGGIEMAIEENRQEGLDQFPVVVTIADGLSRLEEIEQFELINTTQKKVRTDLARRLMAIQIQDPERRASIEMKGRLWEAKGAGIADWLSRNGKVWRGRILPPNKSKREMPTGIARETSFVTSLKPVLQTPFFARMDEIQAAELLDRYWEAISLVFPSSFAHPNEHVIQKTPGVFSLHSLVTDVVELVRQEKDQQFSTENFKAILDPLAQLQQDFWQADNIDGAGGYGGMKGFAQLAVELRSFLPDLKIELW